MNTDKKLEDLQKAQAGLGELGEMLKSHIDTFTRKDGSVVQAHDDKRVAAAPAPTEFGVHHKDLKEGDHLYDKHGQKVDEVEGFSRGVNSAVVHTRAGYSHSTHKGFLPGLSNKKPGAEPAKKKASAPKAAAAKSPVYDHPNVVGKPSKMVTGAWTKETGYKETDHTGKPTEAHAIHFAGKKYLSSGKTATSNHDGTPVRAFDEDTGSDEGGHRVWLDDQARVHADGTSEVPKLRSAYEAHAAKDGKKPGKKPATRS